ncbi:hypothetical protein TH53_19555 [Pedobacter lusitanus]|uniref:Uncharacterized protein n=1 Tax=Pedobacter lusitanus TaxID=1503925 RepID=A0A0D0FTA3_9SPHI|nr:hypothetical protein [Pedobacter lusitanus]KIO75679.1 hypothetical protein TH53_19555 [Pedobacter lusitanus]
MKRRQFITMAGIGTGLLILPPALYLSSPSVRKYAGKLIREELDYLKLDSAGVDQYVNDYFNASSNNIITNLRWKTFYYLGFNKDRSNQIFELIKFYLLSTDFFIHQMDESKTVNYLGLYSPYKSPVPNPYSFVLYPSV